MADVLSIIHQSPSKIVLSQGTESFPIFCVASGHSLDFVYRWNSGDKEIRGNSPVLWISSPGTYSCDVSAGWYKCSSSTIIVEWQELHVGKCVFRKLSILLFSSVLVMEYNNYTLCGIEGILWLWRLYMYMYCIWGKTSSQCTYTCTCICTTDWYKRESANHTFLYYH